MRAPARLRYTAVAVPSHITLRRSVAVAAVISALSAGPAVAAPPAPCGGTPQITDARLDGHHPNTDVTSAWLTESGGRLQAVVQVANAVWEPAHDDSVTAGVAFLYQQAGQTRYVRIVMGRGIPPVYDTGTWSAAGGFLKTADTAGSVTTGPGGSVTIDVPAVAAGTVLARPFVLTYDGIEGASAHWVDRAPGGTSPTSNEFGADFVAGACGGTGGGGDTPTNPVTPDNAVVRTTAIALKAPSKLTGSGQVKVSGRVSPARAGVAVDVTGTGGTSVKRRAITAADGTFSVSLPVSETTKVSAVAEGLSAQTLTVQVYSRVRIKVRRLQSGTVVVTGTTSPKLSGRVLLLRTSAVKATARTTARNGTFQLRLKHPQRGRYQAVFIPNGDRAERSTSNTGVIR